MTPYAHPRPTHEPRILLPLSTVISNIISALHRSHTNINSLPPSSLCDTGNSSLRKIPKPLPEDTKPLPPPLFSIRAHQLIPSPHQNVLLPHSYIFKFEDPFWPWTLAIWSRAPSLRPSSTSTTCSRRRPLDRTRRVARLRSAWPTRSPFCLSFGRSFVDGKKDRMGCGKVEHGVGGTALDVTYHDIPWMVLDWCICGSVWE